MKQPLAWVQTLINSTTHYYAFGSSKSSNTLFLNNCAVVSAPGTLRNFRATLYSSSGVTAPGSGKSWALTLYKNDVATAVVLTIADLATSAEDLTTEITLAAGDAVAWRGVPSGSPAGSPVSFSAEWEGTNAGEAISFQRMEDLRFTASGPDFGGLFACHTRPTTITASGGENVCPTGGTLTAIYVKLDLAPFAGGQFRRFTLYKNGTAQDGTGGTPDTRVTITNPATAGNITGLSLAFSAADRFSLHQEGSDSTNKQATWSARYTPTIDGESIISGTILPSPGAITYHPPTNATSWNADEDLEESIGGPTAFTLRKFYWRQLTAPGAGTSEDYTVRKNRVATSLAITIADAATSGNDTTDEVSIADGDEYSLSVLGTNSPAAPGAVTWSLVAYAANTIQGSAVFGVNTTVSATRAIAMGLDGATNVHDEVGKLKVFGDFEVTGTTTLTGGLTGIVGSQAPGSFTIADEQFGIQGKRLTLVGTERLTLQGTGRLVING